MNMLLYLFFFFLTFNCYSISSIPVADLSEPVPEDPVIVNELIFGKPPEQIDAQQEKQQLMIMKKKAAARKKAQSQREDMMISQMEKKFINKILDSIKKTLLRNAGFILKVMILMVIIIASSIFYNHYKWQNFQSLGLLKS